MRKLIIGTAVLGLCLSAGTSSAFDISSVAALSVATNSQPDTRRAAAQVVATSQTPAATPALKYLNKKWREISASFTTLTGIEQKDTPAQACPLCPLPPCT
jgi:hypothetical protein